MTTGMPFNERIRYAANKVGGQSELARRVSRITGTKVDPQNIQYLCKEGTRSSKLTGAIAEAADLDLTWLMTGAGQPEKTAVTEVRQGDQPYQVTRSPKHPTKTAEGGYRLPKFNATPGAGASHYPPSHEEVIDQLTLSGDFIRKNLSITGIQNLAVLTAYGDSMEETFSSGDSLLVDRGVRDVKIDAVYVLQRDDELFVKRIQRQLDGSLMIISDNKKYEPQHVTQGKKNHLQVLGRVVYCWVGRKL